MDDTIRQRITATASRYRTQGVDVEVVRSDDLCISVDGPSMRFSCHGEDAESLLSIAELGSREWNVSTEDVLFELLDLTFPNYVTHSLLGTESRNRNADVNPQDNVMSNESRRSMGRFGEHYARRWLSHKGYEVRGSSSLWRDLEIFGPDSIYNRRPTDFVPDEEYRRRRIDSLTMNISNIEKRIQAVRESSSASHHLTWAKKQEVLRDRMISAVNDMTEGKPLEEIDDPGRTFSSRSVYLHHANLVREKARNFLGSRVDGFLRYWEQEDFAIPDFIAKKSDDYYAVEVKTNTSKLKTGREGWRVSLGQRNKVTQSVRGRSQKKALLQAEEFGFKPMVIRVAFDPICTEESLDGNLDGTLDGSFV